MKPGERVKTLTGRYAGLLGTVWLSWRSFPYLCVLLDCGPIARGRPEGFEPVRDCWDDGKSEVDPEGAV